VAVSTLTSVGAAGPQPTANVTSRAVAVAVKKLAVFTIGTLRRKQTGNEFGLCQYPKRHRCQSNPTLGGIWGANRDPRLDLGGLASTTRFTDLFPTKMAAAQAPLRNIINSGAVGVRCTVHCRLVSGLLVRAKLPSANCPIYCY
jgi:hypothetical protein